jgi:hypothetical protein
MYLMLYPTGPLEDYLAEDPERIKLVHEALLTLTAEELRGGGRVYGGGLHKMEPKELAALPADTIAALHPSLAVANTTTCETTGKALVQRPTVPSPSAGEIRAWARANGLEVPPRGRLASDVLHAWQRAHSGVHQADAAKASGAAQDY